MMSASKQRSRASWLLLGVAFVNVPATAQTAAEPVATDASRPVIAMGGAVTPRGSKVGALGGLDPLKGSIRTFEGDLAPHVGRIRTFEGDIDPSKGSIRTFEGDIDPFKGSIRTFWGNLTPVAGDIDPKVGRIRTFTDNFLPSSSAIAAAWAAADQTGDFTEVARLLTALKGQTATQWQAEVNRQTGRSFNAAVANPFFSKWNVDLARPETLAGWAAIDRQTFLLDWYDNVLNYSGMDRVDHWMNAVNWTPSLTQVQGGGSQAVIGLVDFFAANDADVRSKVIYSGGYQNVDNAHGAAVGSLIVASHDGKGIMGIAPNAKIAAYNPFDQTYSASWADVETAIAEVGSRGASVINLSLGVPGYTLPAEWRDVFTKSAIDGFKDNTIYVIAAGNDGVVQQADIDLTGALDSTFIVVGSVDPYGRISGFSNTPGTACVTSAGECTNNVAWNTGTDSFLNTDYLKESGLLANRFLVAPGELILVSDGNGGVTRMSGTSFAAPLVSGAIALIQDRWPWLKQYPREVAKIILESAQDLGAPGVDAVYGHGLLDIQAAQSALNFDNLKYYLVDQGQITEVDINTLRSGGIDPLWAANDLYFSAFEKIDSAERDFLIPLSSRLFNQSVDGRAFQKYMHDLFLAWVSNSQTGSAATSLSDSAVVNMTAAPGGWSYALRGRYETVDSRFGLQNRLRSTLELRAPNDRAALAAGSGDGAVALTGGRLTQLSRDFDPYTGGVEPLLGFANGGAHVAGRVNLDRRLSFTVGFANQHRDAEAELFGQNEGAIRRDQIAQIGDYRADAGHVRVDFAMNDRVGLSVAYTRLNEARAFFGTRSLERSDFGAGTVSQSITLAADANLGGGLRLFGSATGIESKSDRAATFRVAGATSTAWQLGLSKQGLIGRSDNLRLTIAQPLTVEQGAFLVQTVGVIDRETGEKGITTQRVDLAQNQRRHRIEGQYGAALLGGLGDVALFGSYELNNVRADIAGWTVGGKARVRF